MKCAVCHNEMVSKRGEIDLRVGGKLHIVRNLPYEECDACGEKVLSPQVSQILFERIRQGDFVETTVTVPVLDGTYG